MSEASIAENGQQTEANGEQKPEELTKVTVVIEYDKTTGMVTLGGNGWEWGQEMLVDFILKKAQQISDGMVAQIAMQQQQRQLQGVPNAQQRAQALQALRNGMPVMR